MLAFADGAHDVLLTTSIIETGLDIPGADTMLSGGPSASAWRSCTSCAAASGAAASASVYLLHEPDAGACRQRPSSACGRWPRFDRLGAGFAISARDLDLRGAGDLLGGEDRPAHEADRHRPVPASPGAGPAAGARRGRCGRLVARACARRRLPVPATTCPSPSCAWSSTTGSRGWSSRTGSRIARRGDRTTASGRRPSGDAALALGPAAAALPRAWHRAAGGGPEGPGRDLPRPSRGRAPLVGKRGRRCRSAALELRPAAARASLRVGSGAARRRCRLPGPRGGPERPAGSRLRGPGGRLLLRRRPMEQEPQLARAAAPLPDGRRRPTAGSTWPWSPRA